MKYYTRQIKKYVAGDIIFSEDSICDGMYIIDSGRVRVFKTIQTGANKSKEVELCVLGPKAMFGEMAMIDESKRSATVQAVEPTACTIISKAIFEDQLNRIPKWMVNMIKILVSRLRETNEKLRKMVEEFTSEQIPEDTILTVQEDESQQGCPSESERLEKKETHSEEIIRDLFRNRTGEKK